MHIISLKLYFVCGILALVFGGWNLDTNAESIPEWVKNTAGWWATDAISEKEFVNAVEFLVNDEVIQVAYKSSGTSSESIPEWVKNTAGWWATDAISEKKFVNAVEYLISISIINVEYHNNPKELANNWKDGKISDDVLINRLNNFENRKYFFDVNDSNIPEWLLNNAGWLSAKIITNSNFIFDSAYLSEEIFPCVDNSIDVSCLQKNYNSFGFRGNEFTEQKSEYEFRIFAVGGSTTYGGGTNDNETWPVHLHRMLELEIPDKKIEVINAGISGANSKSEFILIRDKIVNYEPDLIIIFDGWNDWNVNSIEETISSWESICQLGDKAKFDTIILIQPLPSTGNRILTDQEIENTFNLETYSAKSQEYLENFTEHSKSCTIVDFTTIFDYVQKPVFWDNGHVMNNGTKVIAENVFSIISPIYFNNEYSIFPEIFDVNYRENNDVIYAAGADFSNRNFNNLNLENAIFDKSNLSNTSFTNSKLDGARFVSANLMNSDLWDRTTLTNLNIAKVDIPDNNLKGKDLTGTNLSYVDLSKQDLTGTNLMGATLSHAVLPDNSLKGKDLTGTNLSYVDLSKQDLTGTNMNNSFLFRTNLSGQDLTKVSIINANFNYAILSGTTLPSATLIENGFQYADLSNINFNGKDLSYSNFEGVNFENTDLSNSILKKSYFLAVDFSKIKNNSLKNSDISGAAFAYAFFKNMEFPDVVKKVNFSMTEIVQGNFSEREVSGSLFLYSKMHGVNFENSYSGGMYEKELINDKEFLGLDRKQIEEKIMIVPNFGIVDFEQVGDNAIEIGKMFHNNFDYADLTNANMKNSDFSFAGFTNSNLSNTDFSNSNLSYTRLINANLQGANLQGADLQYANLDGANLDGANLDGANLNCRNHEICN